MLTFRKATLGKVDQAARSVPLVLATDTPVDRSGYIEQLDISPQGCDLSRGDLPLIESHDASTVNVGVVREIRIEGNKLRGIAYFGHSARAEELLADVQAGIVSGVSIGYQLLNEGSPVALPDGRAAKKFRFMPYEVSVVAVPADTEAGFFRSAEINNSTREPFLALAENLQPNLKKAHHPMNTETRDHVAEITQVAGAYPKHADLAISAIHRGLTVEQFQKEVLQRMASGPIKTADYAGQSSGEGEKPLSLGLKRLRTAEDFQRHYRAMPTNQADVNLTMADFMRGAARMKTSEHATRALSAGVDSAGGYAVPSVLMPGVLSALAPASTLMDAGAFVLPLPGAGKSFSVAGIDTLPTAAWRNENAAVSESEPTFREIVLTPRSLSFVVKLSRELLADGLGVDAALYDVIGQAMAKEIDRAGLRGSGSAPEPRGLLNISGVNSVTNGANGATPTNYANLFSAAQAILAADGGMPTAAIMSPRSLVKFGGLADSTGQPMRVPTMLEPLKQAATSQIPNNLTVGTSTDCSEIYVGDFTHFMLGMREQLSIQVLEERYADYGQIAFMVHARLDFAVSNPKRFAIVTGVRA